MRYRIGLKVLEAGRWLGGQMQWYDERGFVDPEGEPEWFTAARQGAERRDGTILHDRAVLHVYWNGEGQVARDGDWIARFPETGAILVIRDWLLEQLALTPARIEVL